MIDDIELLSILISSIISLGRSSLRLLRMRTSQEERRGEQAHNLQGPWLSVQWEVEARALTLALGEVVRDPRHNGGGKSKFRFPSWMLV